MNVSMPIHIASRRRVVASLAVIGFIGLAGCSSLLPKPAAPPNAFLLEDVATGPVGTPSKPAGAGAVFTLVVSEPRAAPGYGTRRIAYMRTPNELEYFAFNQWVEPPALMLAPLLVKAIERTGAFRAVARAPMSVAGDVRLETELVRLQQDFRSAPSRVRLTVHAILIDTSSRKVVASREFDAEAVSPSEDPAGGVAAANQVAQRVAAEVGAFCSRWVAGEK